MLAIANEKINHTPSKTLEWQTNSQAVVQSEPPKGSAEKVLGLQELKYTADTFNIYCSIQGNIPDPLLQQERPDLFD